MTLSVRMDHDIEPLLDREVKRLRVTKSQYVNDLLRKALQPKDAYELLLEIHKKYGIGNRDPNAPRTNNAANIKVLVRQKAQEKLRASRVA